VTPPNGGSERLIVAGGKRTSQDRAGWKGRCPDRQGLQGRKVWELKKIERGRKEKGDRGQADFSLGERLGQLSKSIF